MTDRSVTSPGEWAVASETALLPEKVMLPLLVMVAEEAEELSSKVGERDGRINQRAIHRRFS